MMFRAQQNPFDDAVGKLHMASGSLARLCGPRPGSGRAERKRCQKPHAGQIANTDRCFCSQGNGREPHLRELGIYLGAFSNCDWLPQSGWAPGILEANSALCDIGCV